MQWTGGKESDKKNIKMRQRLDRDETLLLLATLKQGKSTLCCRFRSTRPIIDPLPPPLSSTISWTHRISSANASVLVVVVFVLIFLLQRLYRCHRFLGPVVYPLPPPLLSQIPLMCRVFSVLWQRLRCCCWVWGPILFFWLLRLWYQYPDPVNTPTPPHLETFNQTRCIFWFLNWRLCCRRRNLGLTVNTPTPLPSETFIQTCCIFCFLNWRLCCCSQDLGIVFLCRRLHRGRQFLRPIIATQHPPSSSPNLQSLGKFFYSLSSANFCHCRQFRGPGS